MPRGKPTPTLVVLALATTVLAPPAWPQEGQRPGRFHVGPFWLTPKIVLRNVGFDDNVFNEAGGGVSDRQAVLTPSLDVFLPAGRRVRLSSTGEVGLNYFQREDSERSTDLAGRGRAEIDLGPFTLYGLGGRGHYKQRFSVEIDRRLERTTSNWGGGVRLRAGRRVTLGGQFTRQQFRFEDGVMLGDDSVSGALDRESRATMGTLGYALTPRTSLVFSAEMIDDRFTDQAGGPGEARSYRYLGGFTFQTGALLSGGIRAGLRDYPAASAPAAPRYRGLSLAVDTGLPLGERAHLTLLATRDVNYAVARAPDPSGARRNSLVLLVAGATLDLQLPLSWLARGGLNFERGDYVLPYAGDLDRRDDTRTVSVALFRAFGSTFRVGGNVEWTRRSSNLPGHGYARRNYGLTAEYTP